MNEEIIEIVLPYYEKMECSKEQFLELLSKHLENFDQITNFLEVEE